MLPKFTSIFSPSAVQRAPDIGEAGSQSGTSTSPSLPPASGQIAQRQSLRGMRLQEDFRQEQALHQQLNAEIDRFVSANAGNEHDAGQMAQSRAEIYNLSKQLVRLQPQKYAEIAIEQAMLRMDIDLKRGGAPKWLREQLDYIAKEFEEMRPSITTMTDDQIIALVEHFTEMNPTQFFLDERYALECEIPKIEEQLKSWDGVTNPDEGMRLSQRCNTLRQTLENLPRVRQIRRTANELTPLVVGSGRNSLPLPEIASNEDSSEPVSAPLLQSPLQEFLRHRYTQSTGGSVLSTPNSSLFAANTEQLSQEYVQRHREKIADLAAAEIDTSFSALQIDPDSKLKLGAGAQGSVFEIRLLGNTQPLVFKEVFTPADLRIQAVINRKVQKFQEKNPDATPEKLAAVRARISEKIIDGEKWKIIDEYRVNASAQHMPQVMRVYGLHELDGAYGILAEKIEGSGAAQLGLTQQLALRHGAITPHEYLTLTLQMCADLLIVVQGLADKGCIHGDLQPNNVIYRPEKKVFTAIDYGLGRDVGDRRGGHTPGYGELAGAEALIADPSVDVFSVGQILLRALEFDGGRFGEREFDTGADIAFAEPLQSLSDDRKNGLAEVLQAMISPRQSMARQTAEDLLGHPLFEQLSDKRTTHQIYEKIQEWSQGTSSGRASRDSSHETGAGSIAA